MNFDEILQKILEIAQYLPEKREEFINTFHEHLFTKLVIEIREVDEASADKLIAASQNTTNPDELKNVLTELSANSKVKEKIEQVTNEALGQLADDVSAYATEEQKQQILSMIPAN